MPNKHLYYFFVLFFFTNYFSTMVVQFTLKCNSVEYEQLAWLLKLRRTRERDVCMRGCHKIIRTQCER